MPSGFTNVRSGHESCKPQAVHSPLRHKRTGGQYVGPIDPVRVQAELDARLGRDVYLHLETTTGSYTALGPEKRTPVIAFVRNAVVRYERGLVTGVGPYRVGLKLEAGWVYAQGLTDYTVTERGELLLAGHDEDGNLRVGLQLSVQPFRE
jgi:hypothetical protein